VKPKAGAVRHAGIGERQINCAGRKTFCSANFDPGPNFAQICDFRDALLHDPALVISYDDQWFVPGVGLPCSRVAKAGRGQYHAQEKGAKEAAHGRSEACMS